jgi:molybdopterin-guanine dinucleotide biosynthesis protein
MALTDLNQIIALLEQEKLDIVFIEGFHSLIAKRADVPKIVTAKNRKGLEETLLGTVEPIIAITGIAATNATNTSYGKIPIIKIPEEGQKLITLVKEQLGKVAKKAVN